MGGRVRTEWTNLGEQAWRTQHKFLIRGRDWNQQWREGKQQRDFFGALKWDSATGEPLMVAGLTGESSWDTLIPLLFPYGNFNAFYLVR